MTHDALVSYHVGPYIYISIHPSNAIRICSTLLRPSLLPPRSTPLPAASLFCLPPETSVSQPQTPLEKNKTKNMKRLKIKIKIKIKMKK